MGDPFPMTPNSDDEFPDEPEYEGIPNPWGQYGVGAVYADVLGESGGVTDAQEGDPCVCIDTSMCETTLTIEGAEELIRRIQAAIDEAKEKQAERRT